MAELLERVSGAELTEWAAYAELEPFGAEWDNWRAGMLASVTANVNRARGRPAYQAKDFMPGRREQADWQQIRGAFRSAFGAPQGSG